MSTGFVNGSASLCRLCGIEVAGNASLVALRNLIVGNAEPLRVDASATGRRDLALNRFELDHNGTVTARINCTEGPHERDKDLDGDCELLFTLRTSGRSV